MKKTLNTYSDMHLIAFRMLKQSVMRQLMKRAQIRI